MNLSNTQLDRLGTRLRDSEVPTAEDREMFESYRLAFDDAHRQVESDLGAIAREVTEAATLTTRQKTLKSTVAKLRRIPTRLSQIEDIAGCRVVVRRLSMQDDVFAHVATSLSVTRSRDYRDSPQHGYRAVHLVVRDGGGYRVELQIRTSLQDEWANMSEAIAIEHDIEVKYGNGPAPVHVELARLSDAMSRDDLFQETPDGDDFLKRLPFLVEAAGMAFALERVVTETWPGSDSR